MESDGPVEPMHAEILRLYRLTTADDVRRNVARVKRLMVEAGSIADYAGAQNALDAAKDLEAVQRPALEEKLREIQCQLGELGREQERAAKACGRMEGAREQLRDPQRMP